jgi:hypothetical protein
MLNNRHKYDSILGMLPCADATGNWSENFLKENLKVLYDKYSLPFTSIARSPVSTETTASLFFYIDQFIYSDPTYVGIEEKLSETKSRWPSEKKITFAKAKELAAAARSEAEEQRKLELEGDSKIYAMLEDEE